MEFDNDYEMRFWNEIFGCVNYLNLPYDTVMNMPIHVRKFWIQKHNQTIEEQEKERAEKGNGKQATVSGAMLNSYAKTEQSKKDIIGGN